MEEKRILANRYELIQKIGTGGMAVVYQAYDTALDRQVAVKLLRDEYIDNPDFIRQFQREAKAVAKLSHQNIVNIYDFGKSDGLMYLVMEYVNGCTLKELIAKQGPLPIQQILDYSIQLCYGLAQAHSHNIVHKDIKPHNIMIEHTHIAKITDFGIAQAINHLTMTHSNGVLGSAHYFSPEQARGGYVDERGDIYSLGISLYEMITGKVPFDSDTPVSVALMHIQNEIPSPRNIVPNLPVAVEKIIYKCTQKKADRRYADADALIEDLRNCLVNTNARISYDFTKDDDNLSVATDSILNEKSLENEKTVSDSSNTGDNAAVLKTTLWKKEDLEKEKHRKKDFLEKMYEDKSKNPVVERIITGAIVLVAVAICGFLIWGIVWIKSTLTPPELFNPSTSESSTNDVPQGVSNVKMPKLVGYDSGDAIIELNKLNLKNSIKYEPSDAHEKGEVIAQQYREGTMLKRNTVVELVVSSGKFEHTVDNFENLDANVAEEAFAANKVKLNRIFVYDNEVPMGCVIKTDPAEGDVVRAGDTVDIYISRGAELKNVTVPSLEGHTVEEANAILDPKGLRIGNVTYVESKTVEEGKIITQSYLFNSVLLQGSAIDVTVSLGSGVPVTSITLQQAQFTRFIYGESNEFRKPIAPGVSFDVSYQYATISLELEQTNSFGEVTTKEVGTYSISTSDLPMQINDIEGTEDIYDGTITVYITIGDSRYKVGSYYVEFQ